MKENPTKKNSVQWYQLYVNPNRQVTDAQVKKLESMGYQALCVTVDAPQFGKRERDMRNKAVQSAKIQDENRDKDKVIG